MLGIEIIKRIGGGSGSSGSGVNLIGAQVIGAKYTRWTIDPNGFTYQYSDINNPGTPTLTQLFSWITPQTGTNLYEVRATLLSGNLIGTGTLNTWQTFAAARTWGWDNQILYKTCELKIEIRLISTGAVVDNTVVTLENNGTV